MTFENTAHIIGSVTAFPDYYYSQHEITSALQKLWARRSSSQDRVERFHQNMMINGRYLALPLDAYVQPSSFRERNQEWIRISLELGENAICNLLEHTKLDPKEISLIAFTTITGIAAPSIDARLMNCIPFSSYLKRMPLFGLGCMGGASGLARVADYLARHPDEAALLLSIELCSLTIQHEDLSAENMVATGLFGDGAAAVLMVGKQHPFAKETQPRVIATRAVFFPATEHIMGWDMRDTGFKVVLSADVTRLLEPYLRPAIDTFLEDHGLSRAQIGCWLVHPGGPKIIEAIESGFDLKRGTLDLSRKTLASVGNVSSAAVLVMLEETMHTNPPAPGTYGLLMAMGPGFNAEFVLLEW